MKDPLDQVELNRKLQRVKELATLLTMAEGTILTREQQMENDNWQAKLAFRLNSLVMESKLKEADIRIEVFESMLNVLKKK